jgi:hypothetical protein
MADITLTPDTAQTVHSNRTKANQPYLVWKTVTGAAAAAEKGSALAAADVIKFLDIPANTIVHWARLYVTTGDTGTTLTMDLGYGSNVDVFTDGASAVTAAEGAWGALGTNGKINGTTSNLFTAADTLDIVLASESSSNDDWVVQVVVCMSDLSVPAIPDSTFA